jgi:hypothetical protein
MLKAIGQNAVLLGGLVVGATVSGLTAPLLRTARGALGPEVLAADSIGAATAAVLVSLAVCTGIAVVVGRVCNTAVGMFVLGGGLFGLAWRLDTVVAVVHARPGGGALGLVALETLLWAILVLGVTVAVFRVSGPLRDVEPMEDGTVPDPLFSGAALRSAAAGIVALPVVWMLAQSPMKGQVIGAVFCAGMAAGLVGRLVSPHVQPVLLFASPVLFGALGHVVGSFMLEVPLDDAFVSGAIRPVSLPMPVDWAAGSLMGVAVGLGWARSFLHHEEDADDKQPRIRPATSG